MQSEFKALENNATWTLVDKPKDKNVLPWKWIYKVKYGADGQVDKYKAMYVARFRASRRLRFLRKLCTYLQTGDIQNPVRSCSTEGFTP